MTRSATAPMLAALTAQVVRPIIFFEGQFASGWLRLWTGVGDLVWNGQTWTGAGQLLALGTLSETSEIVASGTTVSLSGVPASIVSACITDARQGLPGRVWLGTLDTAGAVIASPVLVFAGRLDVPDIIDGATECTVSITYESRLIDLQTPREWRWTHESQQALYPDDMGFEFVTSIQSVEVKWGR